MLTLLTLVTAALLVLFVHPYVSYPLSLLGFRERPVRKGAGPRPRSVALLFAAYNEERALPGKLANIAEIKARHPDIDVIAYSDMSSDRTLDMLKARSDLLRVVPSSERTGKATGMRRMVASTDAEICIFTDANVILDPASVDRLLDYFTDPAVGGVAGTLRYINDDESLTAEVSGLYWRLEEWIKQRESRCGSIMGADGAIFATRRALYPMVPSHLLDDMTVSMSTIFAGYRLIHATDVVAYEKNATAASDEFRRKRRIACRAFNTHRHLQICLAQAAALARPAHIDPRRPLRDGSAAAGGQADLGARSVGPRGRGIAAGARAYPSVQPACRDIMVDQRDLRRAHRQLARPDLPDLGTRQVAGLGRIGISLRQAENGDLW
jgi:cellulose synthase/poly-beta-1,6-N-acetylglucosamine synthase-like glycosyltransferase